MSAKTPQGPSRRAFSSPEWRGKERRAGKWIESQEGVEEGVEEEHKQVRGGERKVLAAALDHQQEGERGFRALRGDPHSRDRISTHADDLHPSYSLHHRPEGRASNTKDSSSESDVEDGFLRPPARQHPKKPRQPSPYASDSDDFSDIEFRPPDRRGVPAVSSTFVYRRPYYSPIRRPIEEPEAHPSSERYDARSRSGHSAEPRPFLDSPSAISSLDASRRTENMGESLSLHSIGERHEGSLVATSGLEEMDLFPPDARWHTLNRETSLTLHERGQRYQPAPFHRSLRSRRSFDERPYLYSRPTTPAIRPSSAGGFARRSSITGIMSTDSAGHRPSATDAEPSSSPNRIPRIWKPSLSEEGITSPTPPHTFSRRNSNASVGSDGPAGQRLTASAPRSPADPVFRAWKPSLPDVLSSRPIHARARRHTTADTRPVRSMEHSPYSAKSASPLNPSPRPSKMLLPQEELRPLQALRKRSSTASLRSVGSAGQRPSTPGSGPSSSLRPVPVLTKRSSITSIRSATSAGRRSSIFEPTLEQSDSEPEYGELQRTRSLEPAQPATWSFISEQERQRQHRKSSTSDHSLLEEPPHGLENSHRPYIEGLPPEGIGERYRGKFSRDEGIRVPDGQEEAGPHLTGTRPRTLDRKSSFSDGWGHRSPLSPPQHSLRNRRSFDDRPRLHSQILNPAGRVVSQRPLILNQKEEQSRESRINRSYLTLSSSSQSMVDIASPSLRMGGEDRSRTSKSDVERRKDEENAASKSENPQGDYVSSGSHLLGRAILFKLNAIFDNSAQHKRLLSCTGSDAHTVLDVFQMILDTRGLQDRRWRQLITAMRRISEKTSLYPRRFDLSGPVDIFSDHPVASGSFADIYKAQSQGEDLCLKVIKAYKTSLVEHMAKVYAREAILWGQLSHPNVLPFYGIYPFRSQISFVSPWAEHGHLGDYLEQNPDANRVLLCSDAAAGIAYLHANTIVHGDLKAANVLVDGSGRASLADFGLSNVTDPQIMHWATHSSVASKGGSIRWQAPELHVPEADDSVDEKIIHNTKESDIFAWACLCYEIFTGHLPFFESTRESTVILRISRGDHPTRPAEATYPWLERGLTTSIWDLMEDCWKFNPRERPDISAVISRLKLEIADDIRPPGHWQRRSAMQFRNSHEAGLHQHRPSLEDLDAILLRVSRSE